MKYLTYTILIFIIFMLSLLNYTINKTVIRLSNKITKLNIEIVDLNKRINYKDSITREHMNECAMISKDQLRYGKDGIVYIKDIYRLTYDLGD